MRRWHRLLVGPAVCWAAAASAARADTVELINGDTVTGQVVSLDAKQLKLQSKLLGDLSIERPKIRAIFFGDALPPQRGRPGEKGRKTDANADRRGSLIERMKAEGIDPNAFRQVERLFPQLSSKAKTPDDTRPEDTVRQLREQGLDDSVRKQIEQAFPLLAAPEAQQYFNDTVSGLMSGKLTVQDIRKDAVKVRDQLLDLQKDLGPEAEQALMPYMSILNRFIREAAPREKAPSGAQEKKGDSAQEPQP